VGIELGYQGYISSREFYGERAPQHVQNIVIRSYCQRQGLQYRLSATEHAMRGSFMMLEQLVNEIETIEGLIFFSLFQLPPARAERSRIFQKVLCAKKTIHFAVEELIVESPADARRVHDIIAIKEVLPKCLDSIALENAVS
jgi:sporadic carbohydrate cluster protein (TIGR04323 family)